MGQRREPRKAIKVAVRILGTDASGRPFAEKIETEDVSRCGLRVRNLSVALKLEDIVSVSHQDKKTRYRVKWQTPTTPPPTVGPAHWDTGLENLAPEKSIFDFALPTPVLDNYAGPSAAERRAVTRMRCVTSVELHPEGRSAPIMATISDLSVGGCFVDMPMPLHKGTPLKVVLWLDAMKVQSDAVVSNARPGFGMGVKFIALPGEERAKLEGYLAKIPRFPFR